MNIDVSNNRDLRVAGIATFMKTDRRRLEAMRSSQSHCFVWITKGHGKLVIDGQNSGYAPNTAAYIPANTMHAFHFGQGTQGWILHVDGHFLASVPTFAGTARLNNMFDQAEVCAVIDNINRELSGQRSGMGEALRAHASLLGLTFARKLEQHASQPSAADSRGAARSICARFLKMLAEDFSAHHTVSYYSQKLAITPTHLSRVCRQRFGRPASEILHDRVVSEAQVRLTSSDKRVGQIGADLGFSSSAYFSRLFKQKTGLSPAEFRQKSVGEVLY